MAAAGTTVSTCFSKSTMSFKNNYTDIGFKIAFMRTSQVPSMSHSHWSDSLTLSVVYHKGRTSRISAALVDEEAAGVAETEAVQDVVEENEEIAEKSVLPETEGPTSTKLYFGNLPYNCDSSVLAGIVQDYGSPEMIEVLYDKNTGRSRGFAFVTMSNIEDANAVIENLDGSIYGGRTLKVNFADKPRPQVPLYPESDYKLFVGNLSWSVTSDSLIEVFQEYGEVVGARVLYDGETGRSRGYGFVCYSTKLEMEAALQALDGVDVEGRAIRVSLAQGKKY